MQVVNTPQIQVACRIVSVNMVTPTRVASVSETKVGIKHFNPYLTNEFSHHYHNDESTFTFKGIRSDFLNFIHFFSMKILSANRIAPDGTSRSAASHLGLFCLPMSHKKDTRL